MGRSCLVRGWRPGQAGGIRMRLWRGFGWLLIMAGVVVLGMDMLQSLEDGRLHILSMAEHWANLAPDSYQRFWGVEAEAARGMVRRALAVVMRLPGFAPFMLAGLVLFLVHPQRRRGIFKR